LQNEHHHEFINQGNINEHKFKIISYHFIEHQPASFAGGALGPTMVWNLYFNMALF